MSEAAAVVAPRRWRPSVGSRTGQDYGLAGAFVALFVVLTVASDAFLTKRNLLNLLEANADIGIVACAATLVVVAGGLDLSVGAIFALSGVVSAEVATSTGPGVGLAAGIAVGAAVGAFNGLLVTYGGVNTVIATLATAIMFRGLALVITGGFRVVPDESFTGAGRDALLGVKYVTWGFVVVALITGFLLARARFGRQVAVVGANQTAARLSGVPVERVRWLTFVLSGLAAGIAGVLIASRSGQASADAGAGYELSVIAAVAIGGTSFRGGEGTIGRTVLGVLFLGLVNNGLNLLDVDARYDQLVIGLLILVAVTVDVLGRRSGAARAPG